MSILPTRTGYHEYMDEKPPHKQAGSGLPMRYCALTFEDNSEEFEDAFQLSKSLFSQGLAIVSTGLDARRSTESGAEI
ncbi:hypothetical protein AVEN_250623-1 [Araneus ventricosus]|uniref:Uncharacterized protein n=1 Tax=Araneus ventricosus TaxID=182803 RepID=A0A4Y2DMC4_ARAVE|nr:hypothetical protein AVEN_169419-1 [Araneus ventricosus]GBM17332.1 hypothetical protein AVEN_250623-1 [Araneus ventricosus]